MTDPRWDFPPALRAKIVRFLSRPSRSAQRRAYRERQLQAAIARRDEIPPLAASKHARGAQSPPIPPEGVL